MKIKRSTTLLTLAISAASSATMAQDRLVEEIVVQGIRGSLTSALLEKRQSNNLVEVIQAEAIGKLPDQNLAEVLENVTGVQITRTAGVGTGVQIRGTNANRTEINGVSTVGSGAGRTGINFEDVSAGIISAVEVTKASEAKTIEGSVGGTINLRTIRPLDLTESVASVRLQGENSSLSTDSNNPRVSGTYGNSWSTDSGDVGFVISGSWTQQDVTAFRPRTDRDNLVLSDSGAASAQSFDYLPIQFFIQDYDNFEYETTNLVGTFEWAPSESLRLSFDAIINDQERRQESSRIQASGVSDLRNIAAPSEFETVNFGSLLGSNGLQDLGSIQAAVRGVIPVQADGSDGNLRFSGDTNSRLTDSKIFSFAADWQINDRLSARAEISTSNSDTITPSFNTTLNFINPNVATNSSNENGTPFAYDLTGGSLTFGIEQSAAYNGPTTAQLLDPANVMLRDVEQGQDVAENSEDAFRVDFTYELDFAAFNSVDFGLRRNVSTSLRDEINSNVGLRSYADSPRGNLFADILVRGPDNFNEADGRALYVRDFLTINPELVASDPAGVLATLNAAIVANNAISGSTRGPISSPTSSTSAFFDIEEETNALYAQANFATGIFRGNIGARYLETDITSVGNSILNGEVSLTSDTSSYDFFLPRLNLVADITDDLVIRTGWGKDIRRPNFSDLSSAFTFSTSPNPAVNLGNPGLKPEEVTSFDISAEWYFAPSSVVSIGYFNKKRTGLFVRNDESPFEDPVTGFRDITAPCEQGGIFNPIADINVFGPVGVGVCVPSSQTINGAGETTQEGIELAFQYDLSALEDRLGWASGFGVIANYTKQEFSGGETYLGDTSRAAQVFAANGVSNVDMLAPLIDLSENSYNFTTYYEKYGISARVRYTWREAYRSTDFGSTSSFPWGFPVVQDDRGQVNASISYDFTEKLNVGLEVVNLTEEDVTQHCVNGGALLCFQGLQERRITLGAAYRF
jgi:iron complex outermembrane recepter protein